MKLAIAILLLTPTACLPAEGTVENANDSSSPVPDTSTPVLETSIPAPDTTPAIDTTPAPETSEPQPQGLIVHEWGTFTSVQDPTGKSHPGLHHEDEELPAWVYRRDLGPNAYFEELPEEPLQQLETPVLYFYSPTKLDVSVDVEFPEGIISQWFPGAIKYAPEPYAMGAIAGGSMTWQVTLDASIDPASYLPVDPNEIWAPSRNVASTPLMHIVQPKMVDSEVEREQFIFYRGLGSFDLPVRVTSTSDEVVTIHNDSTDDLSAVVILNAEVYGGAVTSLGSLRAGQSIEVRVPRDLVDHESYVAAAHAALKSAVVATGLYDDEAEAMVDTWTRSWFGNLGIRVLYVVPRSWTDRLLPITVKPSPAELVRTLVGRIEVMTPSAEAETWERIQALGEAPAWDVVETLIDDLGRFAEPRVRQALEKHGTHPGGEQLLWAAHQRP